MRFFQHRNLIALICTLPCLPHIAWAAAPTITAQPVSQSAAVGGSVMYSVTAHSAPPVSVLNYQWSFNGTNLAAATNTSLTLTNVQLSQAGNYSVLVANKAGSVLSSNAVLTVYVLSCDPPPSGLLDWWPGEGTANDIAGTNNGTLVANASAGAPGMVGTGFHFDGTNDYVRIPDSPNFHLTNFTVETWVEFDKLNTPSTGPTPGQQYMVFKQNSQSSFFEGFGLIKDRSISAGGGATTSANGDIFLLEVTSGTTTIEATGVTVISTGVWYHVAAERGTNFLRLYVNGNLDAEVAVNFPQDYGTLPLCLGSSGQPGWDCKLGGSLDEVSLYNRVLSSNEIATIYQAGYLGKCKSPTNVKVAMYPGAHPGVSFAGAVGQTYGVQTSTNLTGVSTWEGLTNLILTAPTNLWFDSQPATQHQRFYRVVNGMVPIP